jgi:uncharacterized membrane protein YdbT with pleckstrin-like domain
MSKYAEKNLRDGEEIVIKAKKNILCFVPALIIGGIFIVLGVMAKLNADELFASGGALYGFADIMTIGEMSGADVITYICVAIGALIILYKFLYLICMDLVITNKRVIGRVGIIAKRLIDYPIEKVESVNVSSSFLGTIFRYASLSVQGANSQRGVRFKGISNTNAFKNAFADAIDLSREAAFQAQADAIALALKKSNILAR